MSTPTAPKAPACPDCGGPTAWGPTNFHSIRVEPAEGYTCQAKNGECGRLRMVPAVHWMTTTAPHTACGLFTGDMDPDEYDDDPDEITCPGECWIVACRKRRLAERRASEGSIAGVHERARGARAMASANFCRRHLGKNGPTTPVRVQNPDGSTETIELCDKCQQRPDHQRWIQAFEANRAAYAARLAQQGESSTKEAENGDGVTDKVLRGREKGRKARGGDRADARAGEGKGHLSGGGGAGVPDERGQRHAEAARRA